MAETRAIGAMSARAVGNSLLPAIAWRNLWRNRRRTWLAASGIAFATGLVMFSMSFQVGGYHASIETATAFFSGHLQVQHEDYIEWSRFEHTINEVTPLMRQLESHPDILFVAPRVEAFSLASVDERSFGVQLLGLDVDRERRTVRFLEKIAQGRMAVDPGEAVLGSALARNLGAGLGDEVVVLGTGKEGSMAAMAVQVTGIFDSGISDFDRSVMLAPITTVQDAFGLGDEAHSLAVRTADVTDSAALAEALNEQLPNGLIARNWEAVLPEIKQGIDVDRLSSVFIYGIIIVVVTFSVVNTFIMTVFERTREFGVLRAIGMRPGAIMGMVQIEAFCIWLLGVGIALGLLTPAFAWLANYGLSLGTDLSELHQGFFIPERLHPKLTPAVALSAPLIMLVGVQLAAFIPSLKIRRLQTIAALRAG